jgi:GntR family transcriptional regulator, transcriptional repressor for pyruvate dehydrogenase complex
MDFKPIPQDDALYKIVARQIERNIREQRLKPGDRLPNETELAKQFGVSRTVIREAIMVLRQANLLDVRHGVGTFVIELPTERTYEQITQLIQRQTKSIWEVHEVRCVLEPEIAALAAARVTPERLSNVQSIFAEMELSLENRDRFIELDLAFHNAVAAATGNSTFSLILSPVMTIMRESRKLGAMAAKAAEETLIDHKEVMNAIEAGDSARARLAMTLHLQHVTNSLRVAESAMANDGADVERGRVD